MKSLKHAQLISAGAGVFSITCAIVLYLSSNNLEDTWERSSYSNQIIRDISKLEDVDRLRELAVHRVTEQNEQHETLVEIQRSMSEILLLAAVVYFLVFFLVLRASRQLRIEAKRSPSDAAT